MIALEELEQEVHTLNRENERLQVENAVLSVKLKLIQDEKHMHMK